MTTLLADGEVEAIYNPLANSLHGPWNKRALLAGKHVLSEKPSAGDGAEAAELEAIADGVASGVHGGLPLPLPPDDPAGARRRGQWRDR